MKLHQLKAFLAVIETGNFSQAALNLDLSQASVSQAVAELEKSLGVKLFERGRFGAKPTDLATQIATQARIMFNAKEAIEQSVSLSQGELTGELRVAAHPSLASKVIPALFAHLRQSYPALSLNLQVMMSNEALEQSLRDNQADVALVLYESSEDLLAWRVIQDNFIALVPSAYPLTRDVIGAEELRAYPNVLQRGRQCGQVVRNYLDNLGVPASSSAFLDEGSQAMMNEGQIIVDLVSQELGVAVVASMLVNHLPENIKRLSLEHPLYRDVIAAINPNQLKTPAVRVFLNALKDNYPESELPYLGLQELAPQVAAT